MLQNKRSSASLNVKDPEAHRLAQAIAKATGETITRVVTEASAGALRTPPQTAATKPQSRNLFAIAKRASAQVKHPYLDHAALLYDERGLPK